ncbi:MAG TPA: dihydrofolate reductase family protein, partial [Pyrinomonadaceae bacterium]|nr:dihydrofolate reductase family protein [Pyrinomonadaceae bacterium]
TYDLVDGWGGSHPLPGVPVFVLTHDAPNENPKGKTPFTYVTDGIASAITQAKEAAGDKNVYVIGGANVAQQCIREGQLDEIRLHIAPHLFGAGIRLFDNLGTEPIELETMSVIEAPEVAHLGFRVPITNKEN